MKKIFGALFISLSIFTHLSAESYIDYVSVGVAMQTLQDPSNPNIDNSILKDKKGTAVVLTAGKLLYSDIGVELEGSTSVKKAQWRLGDSKSDVDFWSLGLYGSYIWRINNLSIKPRVGVVFENIKSTIRSIDLVDKSDVGLSGSIGMTYHFGDNYAIYSNYTKFEDDMNHLTFGAEYKF